MNSIQMATFKWFVARARIRIDIVKPYQVVIRRYVISADYEYNPELIEVK